MLDALAHRLQGVFRSLRGEARLTESVVDAALRDIRLALLEADVHFKVVKAFVEHVRARALEPHVLRSLTPAQHVVKIVRDEMVGLFGDVAGGLRPAAARTTPRVVLVLGLQGSGKTTSAAKLGRWLARQRGHHPLLVSTDVRRPAAIEQLNLLGRQADLPVHDPAGDLGPVGRAQSAVAAARTTGFDVVVVDTAGRLHIDDELMEALLAIARAVDPTDRLYVADAMTGQDAVRSAGEFHRRLGITGILLTKLDGDARGGAALSIVSVVGAPIAFAGTGEGVDDIEIFQPARLVGRVLGMGDILSLVERAEQAIEHDQAARLAEKLHQKNFTLEDFREQLKALRRMGPLEQIVGMLPGMGNLNALAENRPDDRQLARVEAIVSSMTPQERRNQQIINGSRRRRIARGSGTSVEEVNRLLRQFAQMRKMLKTVGAGARRKGGRLEMLTSWMSQ